MNDTSPEIAEMLRELMSVRSGTERIRMASDMFESAKTLIRASFPPGLSETEVTRRLCERLYGDEIDVEEVMRAWEARKARDSKAQPHPAPDSDRTRADNSELLS